MNEPKIHPFKEQRGVVLVISLLVLTILSVLGLAFLTTARTEDMIASNYRNHTAAFYAAEAGLESGMASLKVLLATSPTPTVAQLDALAPPALTDPNYTFVPNAFQVRRVRTKEPYEYQTSLTSGIYQGLNGLTTDYLITATVTGPRGSRARLTQRVQRLRIPLFQFAAFYGKGVDLEIAPGPAMTLNGRIHSNSNLHLVTYSNLKIDSFVTTTGDIHRYRKSEPYNWNGTVEIRDAGGSYQALNFEHEYDYDFQNTWSAADWKKAALSTFGGRVQDSAMGVQEIIPPIPDALYDPAKPDVSSHLMIEKGLPSDTPDLKEAKIYYQADLRIENGVVKKKDGTPVNLVAQGCSPQTVTTKTFYDAREQQNMVVTEVNVGMLKDCKQAPANGILYASGSGPVNAVRLVNGAELPGPTAENPNGGLTVVSENPVYIQGDYNTVNKVPAAVMGDAVTVLSNNWGKDYDKKGKDTPDKRPAAPTTVNAAIATGPSAESTEKNGNGELNNLLRFLEDWKGAGTPNVPFNYNGSLVALWHSEQATKPWRCCGGNPNGVSPDFEQYYNPPKRDWKYDTLFNTAPPPGTPMGIITMRGQWSEG